MPAFSACVIIVRAPGELAGRCVEPGDDNGTDITGTVAIPNAYQGIAATGAFAAGAASTSAGSTRSIRASCPSIFCPSKDRITSPRFSVFSVCR